MPHSASWLLAATCVTLLTGCPLPCPSGTTPHGGDQCDPDALPPFPKTILSVKNQTEKPLTIDFDMVNPVDCPRGGSDGEEATTALAARVLASTESRYSQSLTLGVGASGSATITEPPTTPRCTAVHLRVAAEGFQRVVLAWPARIRESLIFTREASGDLRLEGPRGLVSPPHAPDAAPR